MCRDPDLDYRLGEKCLQKFEILNQTDPTIKHPLHPINICLLKVFASTRKRLP